MLLSLASGVAAQYEGTLHGLHVPSIARIGQVGGVGIFGGPDVDDDGWALSAAHGASGGRGNRNRGGMLYQTALNFINLYRPGTPQLVPNVWYSFDPSVAPSPATPQAAAILAAHAQGEEAPPSQPAQITLAEGPPIESGNIFAVLRGANGPGIYTSWSDAGIQGHGGTKGVDYEKIEFNPRSGVPARRMTFGEPRDRAMVWLEMHAEGPVLLAIQAAVVAAGDSLPAPPAAGGAGPSSFEGAAGVGCAEL